ncbi:UNKNOWN [Stylonychia lemnae]|uniref:Transmembrane protein n=1 Tax=Stylonychia lemnae TaxID=5949 RepID=A0A078AI26_STYLE|nr:UNKNOWN [Stylonychia lemnae]|eukprot:CDW80448.1 UNKNOWN [Stylonychia lemnae]
MRILPRFIWILIYSFQITQARQARTDLFSVSDTLEIFNEHDEILGFYQLNTFPFIESYTQNNTAAGQICYAESLSKFLSNCKNVEQYADYNWILLTPFDGLFTNQLLFEAQNLNISAVIIGSEQQIESGGYYINPVISQIMKLKFQKIITLISVIQMGILQMLLYYFYLKQCPWTDQLDRKYMQMSFITISTIYQTLFVAVLMLISKGWAQHMQLSRAALPASRYFGTTKIRLMMNLVEIYKSKDQIDIQSIVFHFYFDTIIIFAILLAFRPSRGQELQVDGII